MKNGDVYFTTITTNTFRQITIKKDENLIPHVPVKIDILCGQEIRGKSLCCVSGLIAVLQ